MIRQDRDGERRRLLAATDYLLDRIEELRLEDQVRLPERLRGAVADVAGQLGVRPRPSVLSTLANAHDHVLRLQANLLRAGGRAPRPQTAPRTKAAATSVLSLPARESASSEAEWLERVRLTVQRACDRTRYLAAQAEGAPTLHAAGAGVAEARSAQAMEAQRAFDDLLREARRITGRSQYLDPVPALPEDGRFELGDVVVQHDDPHVLQGDRPVRLTLFERRILIVLAANADGVVTREAMQHVVTRADPLLSVDSKVLDVHLSHLRSKLGVGYVETVRGIGYRLPARLARTGSTDADQVRSDRRRERREQVRRNAGMQATEPAQQRATNRRQSGR